MKKPNVLVIIADDMCYGDLSRVNGGLSSTPYLDALADDSVCLTQGYSGSCVCAPARAALLTGRYPHRTGVVDLNDFHGLNRLSPSEVTLGDVFTHNGYRTGLVGKWHVGYIPSCHPNQRGFHEFHGFLGGPGGYWQWQLDNNGTLERSDGRYLTEVLTDYAVDFIETTTKMNQPFLLYLAYFTPHRPLEAEPGRLKKYLGRDNLTPGQAHVYAMIESMDEGIGRVIETLRRLGILDDTIVLFTSDNGPDPVNDGDLSPVRPNNGLNGTKYQVYDGGIRVPFLLRWPSGIPSGRTNNSMIHFIDILPTLASLCRLSVPDGPPIDGMDRGAALREETDQYPMRFWQWNRYYPISRCNAAMRDGNWKLVYPEISGSRHMVGESDLVKRFRAEGPEAIQLTPPPQPKRGPIEAPELYDLGTDPFETQNIAAQNPGRLEAMTKELDHWFRVVMREFDEYFTSTGEYWSA